MKRILTLFLFMCLCSWTYAQDYYSIIAVGAVPPEAEEFPILETVEGETVLIEGEAFAQQYDDYYSDPYELPFEFDFNGTMVNQFWASSTGYLTFDEPSGDPVRENTLLPNADAPSNAIFPFWDDHQLLDFRPNANLLNNVKVFEYGEEPNRTVAVEWFTTQVRNTQQGPFPALRLFRVLLHEQGGFDFHYLLSDPGGAAQFSSATIGYQGADGTDGTAIRVGQDFEPNESPMLNQVMIRFVQDPKMYDVAVFDSYIPARITVGSNVTGQITAVNYGTEELQEFEVTFEVEGQDPYTRTINVGGAPTGSAFEIPLQNIVVPSDMAGETRDISFTVTSVNGMEDEDLMNGVGSGSLILQNGTSAQRNVHVEEYTGTWCQFCPQGHEVMDRVLRSNPEGVLLTMTHAGDPMEFPEANGLLRNYPTGYPTGTFDRRFWIVQEPGPDHRSGANAISRAYWENAVTEQLNAPAPAEVKIVNGQYNRETGRIDLDVEVTIVDYLPDGLTMNLFVTEDNVSDPGNEDYDQRDARLGQGGYIEDYVHKYVLRQIPTGTWGIDLLEFLGRDSYELNQTYTGSLSFDLPLFSTPVGDWEDMEIDDMEVDLTAFLARIVEDDHRHDEIYNSDRIELSTIVSNEELLTNKAANAGLIQKIYPNPSKGLSYLQFNLNEGSNVSVRVFDSMGREMTTIVNRTYTPGNHTVYFNTENVPAGVYTVQVETEFGSESQRIVVAN